MTLWRKARTEVAGAWRSVRYDLGRTGPDADNSALGPWAPEPAPGRQAGYPDVTSTGLSTFGGAGITGGLRTSYGEQLVPRPRRLAAASAFGVLAVVGAAGSYLAVVNGIGALVGDKPVGAEPYPLAAEAPRGSEGELSNSGLGRGTAHPAGRPPAAPTTTAEPAPGTIRVLPATTAGVPAAPRIAGPRPPRTTDGGPQASPDDCCLAPPVPTPTAPVPTPHSPSATPSPTSSAPDDGGSPEPSESPSSAAPTGSDDDTGTDEGETRRRHADRH
jgi:hypothetical protein